jgi:low affinity Fe/Cu permease
VTYDDLAILVSAEVAKPRALIAAVALVLAWMVAGPFMDFSDTWQLLINTPTTVITFLMVFVLAASQNRDTSALQLKLDELIRATERARNEFIGIEKGRAR